jgi:hypothetical protein
VEGGYGERLPSIDTRPPRMRDSDAIIEVCDDFSQKAYGILRHTFLWYVLDIQCINDYFL